MHKLVQDLRYSIRVLLKNPGVSLIAIITLGLGIGANTALFSVVNAVLISPLPFRQPDRLMALGQNSPKNRAGLSTTSHRNFVDWREQNKSFEEMAAYRGNSFTLTGQGEAVQLRGAVVTHDLFVLLDASPLIGRTFLPEDDLAGGGSSGRPAILSWNCWQQYFGGDPDVVGRELRLDGNAYFVVGVMPSHFMFPVSAQPTEIWTSTALDAEGTNEGSIMVSRGYRAWRCIGRLKSGVSVAAARDDLSGIAANLAVEYPDYNRDVGITITPLLDWLVSNVRMTLLLLLGAVGCVLLIACVNVANLLLGRALSRHKEISIRLALGASRLRIARQLLTESVMLAGLGGAVGLMFAWWGKDALVAMSPDGIARLGETRLDWRVMTFTVVVALITGLLFGLAPAFTASQLSLGEGLKEGGRSASGGKRLSGARKMLVVFEVAVALVLLIGAGLLVHSLLRLQQTGLGFDTKNVLTFGIAVSDEAIGGGNASPQRLADFYREVETRLRSLPGVTSTSVTYSLPLSGNESSTGLTVEGRALEPGRTPMGLLNIVGVDYFRTIGIPLLEGREFTASDDLRSPPVLMVNETLARLLFPDEQALGKRIEPSFAAVGETRMREIVGVVRDSKHSGPREEAVPEIYFAQAQMPLGAMTVIVRTTGDPLASANGARDAVHSLNKDVPVYGVRSLDQYFARNIAPARFNTILMSLYAGVACAITLAGLYGVISYAVNQSSREYGIRLALGADAGDILWMVIKKGMSLVLLGVALGLTSALALTRLMTDLLFSVSATDGYTFVLLALLLGTVALVACYVPARRATKVDPIVALRCE